MTSPFVTKQLRGPGWHAKLRRKSTLSVPVSFSVTYKKIAGSVFTVSPSLSCIGRNRNVGAATVSAPTSLSSAAGGRAPAGSTVNVATTLSTSGGTHFDKSASLNVGVTLNPVGTSRYTKSATLDVSTSVGADPESFTELATDPTYSNPSYWLTGDGAAIELFQFGGQTVLKMTQTAATYGGVRMTRHPTNGAGLTIGVVPYQVYTVTAEVYLPSSNPVGANAYAQGNVLAAAGSGFSHQYRNAGSTNATDQWVTTTTTFEIPQGYDALQPMVYFNISSPIGSVMYVRNMSVSLHPQGQRIYTAPVTLSVATSLTPGGKTRNPAASGISVATTLSMTGRERYTRPIANFASDPEATNSAMWLRTSENDVISVTTEDAYTGNTSVKNVKTVANSYSIAYPLRNPGNGFGVLDTDVIAGQMITLRGRVKKVPTSVSSQAASFVRFRNAANQILAGADYDSITTDGTWKEIVSGPIPTPPDAVSIEAGFYMSNTFAVGDGYYLDAISYEKDNPVQLFVGTTLLPTGVERDGGQASLSVATSMTISAADRPPGVVNVFAGTTLSATGAFHSDVTASVAVPVTLSATGANRGAGASSVSVPTTLSAAVSSKSVGAASISVAPSLSATGTFHSDVVASVSVPTTIGFSAGSRNPAANTVSVPTTLGATGAFHADRSAELSVPATIAPSAGTRTPATASISVATSLSIGATMKVASTTSVSVATTLTPTGAEHYGRSASLPVGITLGASGTGYSPVSIVSFGAYEEQVKASNTSHTFDPVVGPAFTGTKLVICKLTAYKTSSSSVTMSATYNGVAMNSSPIVFGNNSNGANTSYSIWFWIFSSASAANIVISDSTPGFATPNVAISSYAVENCGSVGNYVGTGDAGTAGGATVMSISTSVASTPRSLHLVHFCHEPTVGSNYPSNQQGNGQSITFMTNENPHSNCRGSINRRAGDGGQVTFTATRDSSRDWHADIIELLPV